MKLRTTVLAIASLIATTAAHAGLTAAPNPVKFTGWGGKYYYKTVVVTNQGPGFASNLDADLKWTSGTTGSINKVADTCTGATLAVGGTCTVRLLFDSGCPKAGGVNYNLVITSTQMPTLTVKVTGTTTAGACV